MKEALADSDERVEEGSAGTSEWENLLDQHEVCQKKVADNQHRIVDLDKQLQEVWQLLVKKNQWLFGFVLGANPTSSGATCDGPSSCSLDIVKMYTTFFAYKFHMKR